MCFCYAVLRQLIQLPHAGVASGASVAVAHAASAGDLLDSGVDHAAPEAMFEALMEVANFPQFVFDPAVFNFLLIRAKRGSREIIFLQSFECSFGGQHSALDRQMNSF